MEVDSDTEKTPWTLKEASLSRFKSPSNLPSSSSWSSQPNANPQSSPGGHCGTTGVSSSGIVGKGKVTLPSVSSAAGIRPTLSVGEMLWRVKKKLANSFVLFGRGRKKKKSNGRDNSAVAAGVRVRSSAHFARNKFCLSPSALCSYFKDLLLVRHESYFRHLRGHLR